MPVPPLFAPRSAALRNAHAFRYIFDAAARRLAELESGRVKPLPGDEVMARARKIVGR